MDAFLTAARGRLVRLQAEKDAGTLDVSSYDAQRRAIERELGDHLLAAPDVPAARPSRRLVTGLSVLVLAVALLGYWKTGSPSLWRTGGSNGQAMAAEGAPAGPAPAGSDADRAGLQQIAGMVDTLAARMKERPDDAEGWTMLARSYTVLGRFAEALPAYRRASELQPRNANLLADYADAVAATKGSANNPESVALVERALAVDPSHPKALALAGTADYDRGDYAGAVTRWQQIADRLPPDSDLGKQVLASIAEARQKAAAGGRPLPAAPPVTPNGTTAPAAPATASAPAAAASGVSGVVTLDPALASKVGPGDTVYVFARAAGGGRMPLAVQKAKVSDLPLSFRLDDSMAMAPGAPTVSSASRVVVGARISRSGQAIPQAGDLAGEIAAVVPGTGGLQVRIDKVVGGAP